MNTAIHIDAVQLDLRGLPPDVARATAESLGPALQAAIAAQLAGRSAAGGATRIDRVQPAPLRLGAIPDVATLRASIVQQVAASIAGQLPAADAPPASATAAVTHGTSTTTHHL